MKNMNNKILGIGAVSVIFLLAGCGGTQATNQMLTKAKDNYHQMKNDTLVVKHASVALQKAQKSVDAAQSALKNGKKKAVVNHKA
jgi:outer membrane murein-binding lipoprotein Lpp